jgi:hypothetical protein
MACSRVTGWRGAEHGDRSAQPVPSLVVWKLACSGRAVWPRGTPPGDRGSVCGGRSVRPSLPCQLPASTAWGAGFAQHRPYGGTWGRGDCWYHVNTYWPPAMGAAPGRRRSARVIPTEGMDVRRGVRRVASGRVLLGARRRLPSGQHDLCRDGPVRRQCLGYAPADASLVGCGAAPTNANGRPCAASRRRAGREGRLGSGPLVLGRPTSVQAGSYLAEAPSAHLQTGPPLISCVSHRPSRVRPAGWPGSSTRALCAMTAGPEIHKLWISR